MNRYDNTLALLRAATGPDRKLDAVIAIALADGNQVKLGSKPGTIIEYYYPCTWGTRTVQTVTSSIDAALSLVEKKLPGWSWAGGFYPYRSEPISCFPQEAAWCRLFPKHHQEKGTGNQDAHTTPLAILIALFEALKTEQSCKKGQIAS